jgi:hypothetical protein
MQKTIAAATGANGIDRHAEGTPHLAAHPERRKVVQAVRAKPA